jgi:hypothetical protein
MEPDNCIIFLPSEFVLNINTCDTCDTREKHIR